MKNENENIFLKLVYIVSGTIALAFSYNNHEDISYCTSEEADPRLVRHMIHCVLNEFQKVGVYTGDTDVIVLLISHRHIAGRYETSDVYVFSCADSFSPDIFPPGHVLTRQLPT